MSHYIHTYWLRQTDFSTLCHAKAPLVPLAPCYDVIENLFTRKNVTNETSTRPHWQKQEFREHVWRCWWFQQQCFLSFGGILKEACMLSVVQDIQYDLLLNSDTDFKCNSKTSHIRPVCRASSSLLICESFLSNAFMFLVSTLLEKNNPPNIEFLLRWTEENAQNLLIWSSWGTSTVTKLFIETAVDHLNGRNKFPRKGSKASLHKWSSVDQFLYLSPDRCLIFVILDSSCHCMLSVFSSKLTFFFFFNQISNRLIIK